MSILTKLSLTSDAYDMLQKSDEAMIGSKDYSGVAYFWNYSYRHNLRASSYSKRKAVHHAFIKAGLDIAGESEAHWQIILRITEPALKKQRKRKVKTL